jgi:predicted phosphodiesterase
MEMMRAHPWQPPQSVVDVVILAGDIGSHAHGMEWAAATFRDWPGNPKIVYIVGNHEFYGDDLGLLDDFRKAKWERAGVHFLENKTLELPGLRILGCTLWSAFDLYGTADASMATASRRINDYALIRGHSGKLLEPKQTLKMHKRSVKWLDAELAKPFDGKTVVATHFAPHLGCVPSRFQGGDITPYFTTDLSWLMEKHHIDVWCYGHTHSNINFVAENGCEVISNQRGYPSEAIAGGTGFHCDFVWEL